MLSFLRGNLPWSKIQLTISGHSLGGALALLFACL